MGDAISKGCTMIIKCKMCGGTIEFNPGDTVGVCDSCGTKQTLPRLDIVFEMPRDKG